MIQMHPVEKFNLELWNVHQKEHTMFNTKVEISLLLDFQNAIRFLW